MKGSESLSEPVETVTENQEDYSSDNAITLLDDDGLDRREFAITIADSIAKRLKKPSYVIGLLGPWGCGKTSLKNMMLDRLNQLAESERPLIIEFNPWQFRSADALFGMFFEQIAGAVDKKDEDTAAKLRSYSKTLSYGSSVGTVLLAAATAATGGLAAPLALALTELMKSSSEATGAAANLKDKASPDLQEQKKGLAEAMKELQRPVLIVIDDIDRLYAEEIALIFQLVKANADFPNFTYLLLYDKDIVASSLENKVIAGNGYDYLEKIVQYPIDIPQPNSEKICQAWVKGVQRIFQELKVQTPENEQWYQSLQAAYREGLYLYIENLRDVWRSLNALEFSLPVLVRNGYLDVDLVDFAILAVIRIHEPDVFALLPLYKAALTGDKQLDLQNNRNNAPEGALPHPYEVQMDTLLQTAKVSENVFRRRALHKILSGVFPHAPWPKLLKFSINIGYRISTEDYSSWRESSSHLGIGNEENFNRYFIFSLEDNTIAESQVEAIIKSQDREFLLGQFREWEAQNRLPVWVERIHSSIQSTNTTGSDTFLCSWLEFGDISKNNYYFRHLDRMNPPCVLTINALSNRRKTGSQPESGSAFLPVISSNISDDFLKIIQETQGVYLPVRCIEVVDYLNAEFSRSTSDKGLVSKIVLNQCREICSKRIADLAMQQELGNHPYVDYLLKFWLDVNRAAAQQWIDSVQDDATQLFKIIRAWSRSSQSSYGLRSNGAASLLALIPLTRIDELASDDYTAEADEYGTSLVQLMREELPFLRKVDAQMKEQENLETVRMPESE